MFNFMHCPMRFESLERTNSYPSIKKGCAIERFDGCVC
jgi:hypothetical protein